MVCLCLYLFLCVCLSLLFYALLVLTLLYSALRLLGRTVPGHTHTAGRRPTFFVSCGYDAVALDLRGTGCFACAGVGREAQ